MARKPETKPPVQEPELNEQETPQPPAPEVIPALTSEQKLVIREGQVQALQLANQSRQLLEKSAEIEKQIAGYINQAAAALKVDGKVFAFDIQSLNFYKIPEK